MPPLEIPSLTILTDLLAEYSSILSRLNELYEVSDIDGFHSVLDGIEHFFTRIFSVLTLHFWAKLRLGITHYTVSRLLSVRRALHKLDISDDEVWDDLGALSELVLDELTEIHAGLNEFVTRHSQLVSRPSFIAALRDYIPVTPFKITRVAISRHNEYFSHLQELALVLFNRLRDFPDLFETYCQNHLYNGDVVRSTNDSATEETNVNTTEETDVDTTEETDVDTTEETDVDTTEETDVDTTEETDVDTTEETNDGGDEPEETNDGGDAPEETNEGGDVPEETNDVGDAPEETIIGGDVPEETNDGNDVPEETDNDAAEETDGDEVEGTDDDEVERIDSQATEEIHAYTLWYIYKRLPRPDGDGDKVEICRVCLCDFEENEYMRILPCMHRFHLDCSEKWLRTDKRCPLCRWAIDEQYEDQLQLTNS